MSLSIDPFALDLAAGVACILLVMVGTRLIEFVVLLSIEAIRSARRRRDMTNGNPQEREIL
jgi:hypothetical protein